jgi:hypothetical protein
MRQERWLKIKIHFNLDTPVALAREVVYTFERKFQVKQMYYAYYQRLTNIIEVSALTAATKSKIVRHLKRCSLVRTVEVEERGSGSLAHAHAYQMIKAIYAKDADPEEQLRDTLHWSLNMFGKGYFDELAYHGREAASLAEFLRSENNRAIEENAKAMKAARS